MYEAIKEILLELFKAPKEPPESPAGTYASLKTFRASPQFLQYQFFLVLIGMIILSIVFFAIGIFLVLQRPPIGMIVCIILVLLWILIAVGAYFVVRLEYDMRYYIVSDRSLRIRKGVFFIMEQTLTFANIQNIQVEQGPLERLFGISSLVVVTAGGGAYSSQEQKETRRNYHQAVLNGLENAEEIRDLILNYLRQLPYASGLGHPEDQEDQRSIASPGFSHEEIPVLKEILQEVKEWRASLHR